MKVLNFYNIKSSMKIFYLILIYVIIYIRGNIEKTIYGINSKLNRNSKIVIIGSELSGCILAWNLKKSGYNPIIIETKKELTNPFPSHNLDDNNLILLNNFIWPKENNEHFRELLTLFDIKKRNINRSIFLTNKDGHNYYHGMESSLSNKYNY